MYLSLLWIALTAYAGTDNDGDGHETPYDCDDGDAAINPDATEICDEIDNDCDGLTDEFDPDVSYLTFYLDADGDGYGETASTIQACEAPTGYAAWDADCDDSAPGTHPSAPEFCDEIDTDCDGVDDPNNRVTRNGIVNYTTIQSAITAAAAGDALTVCPGTYNEALSVTLKDLTIEGAGGVDPTIDASGLGAPALSVSSAVLGLRDLLFTTGGGDRGIDATDATLTIESASVQGNQTPGDGAGIHLFRGGLTIESSTIHSNDALGDGGGVYAFEAPVTIRGSYVYNNTADGDGGGLYTWQHPLLVEGGSWFSQNEAGGLGGGLYTIGDAIDLSFVNIEDNTAGAAGGAYLHSPFSTIADTNALLNDATSGSGGGLLISNGASGGSAILQRVVAFQNTASAHGGGLYLGDIDAALHEVTLEENDAGIDGGGGYAYFSEVAMFDALIAQNQAGSAGGGLYLHHSPTTLDDADVSQNGAGLYGGGLAAAAATLDLIDASVSQNSAPGGGGVSTDTDPLTLTRTIVWNNTATSSSGGGISASGDVIGDGASHVHTNQAQIYGGGVFTNGALLSGLTIHDNSTPQYGGGVASFGGCLSIEQVTARANEAERGGGVYALQGAACSGAPFVQLSDALIDDNEAEYGGGLHLYTDLGGSVVMRDVEIEDNEATADGGGLWIGGLAVQDYDMERVALTGNVSDTKGGGIRLMSAGGFVMGDVEIAENEAAKGGGICAEKVADFWGHGAMKIWIHDNAAERGGGYQGPLPATLSSAIFEGNTATHKGGGAVFLNKAGGSNPGYLDDVDFLDNTVTSGEGGGLYLDAYPRVTYITGGAMQKNSANSAGAIWFQGGYAEFTSAGTDLGSGGDTNTPRDVDAHWHVGPYDYGFVSNLTCSPVACY